MLSIIMTRLLRKSVTPAVLERPPMEAAVGAPAAAALPAPAPAQAAASVKSPSASSGNMSMVEEGPTATYVVLADSAFFMSTPPSDDGSPSTTWLVPHPDFICLFTPSMTRHER